MNDPTDQNFADKLEITIPEETHTAGKPNVTRVVIHNPHDYPVEIIDIQAPQSSQIRRLLEPRNNAPKDASATINGKSESSLSKFFGAFAITEVSFGGIRAEFPRGQNTLNINAEPKSSVTVEENLESYEAVNISAEEGSTVQLKHKEDPTQAANGHTRQIVAPRCDKVAYFTIATRGWLFFTPQRINLSTEVRYKIKGQERSQVVTSYFEIKPPLGSMIIGAVVGGGLGAAARLLQNQVNISAQEMAVQAGAAIIMSLIASIALSRKTGTQGFITVEDFFGAFVIGALIGYGGSEYFDRAILPIDKETTG